MNPLHLAARHGRLVLVAGLVAGIALPGLAAVLQGWIPQLAALMLFVTALRIGPRQVLGQVSDLSGTLKAALVLQLVLPLLVALALLLAGLHGPLADALVLLACAPPISGAPALVLLTGRDPAPALRLLILGTALVPLTVIPAFLLWPQFGDLVAVLHASVRLVALIGGAAALAFLLRGLLLPRPSEGTLRGIDGLAALAMALVVIGLMADFGPALTGRPADLAAPLALAFAVNFGLQLATRRIVGPRDGPALPICAGNRNMMLFVAALPVHLTQPLMLFVACYQVPMYLTPVLLGRLYRAP